LQEVNKEEDQFNKEEISDDFQMIARKITKYSKTQQKTQKLAKELSAIVIL
jgi:hypothetical protein